MKTKSLWLLLSLIATPLGAMEAHTHEFLTPEEVLQQAEPVPEELSDAFVWIQEHADLFHLLQLPKSDDCASFLQHGQVATQGIELKKLKYQGEGNYNFLVGPAVVKCAGFKNQLHSKISSIGKDPIPEEIAHIFDGHAMYRDDVIQQATHCTTPCHQHTSAVAYYLLMKKRLDGKKIQAVPTYPVYYGNGAEFHDGNYVVVQPRLPERCQLVSKLPARDFDLVVNVDLLPYLADAVDAGGWNLDAKNIWYDPETRTFHITDLEKPNNEGFGREARWKTAVLNNGLGTEVARAWKWNHNRECGYDAVRSMLELSIHKDQLQARWDQLRNERMGE